MKKKTIIRNIFLTICIMFFMLCSFITSFILKMNYEKNKLKRNIVVFKNLKHEVVTINKAKYLLIYDDTKNINFKTHKLIYGTDYQGNTIDITWEIVKNKPTNALNQKQILIPFYHLSKNKNTTISTNNKIALIFNPKNYKY